MRLREARIDLSAIEHNFSRVRQLAPNSNVVAMVKSDAYGHGLVEVARCLHQANAFGVSLLEEAITLRQANISNRVVLMIGVLNAEELAACITHNIEIVVHQPEHLILLKKAQGAVTVWLKIDVAMHRLGFRPDQLAPIYSELSQLPTVNQPIHLMSHLPNADNLSDPSTRGHIALFDEVARGFECPRSVAKSAGLLAWSQGNYDWVRPGIMLYGISPFAGYTGLQHQLKPAMHFRSKVVAVRHLRAGETVSYGGTWRCPEDMMVAIVGVGYSDGYPRSARSGTPVLINGRRCQLVGRVCMDMLTVDCRQYPEVALGDDVVLWGESLPIEWVARQADTIAYELICRVSNRVKVIQR